MSQSRTSSYFAKRGPSKCYVDKGDVLENMIEEGTIKAEESNFGYRIQGEGSLMSSTSRRSMNSSRTSNSKASLSSEKLLMLERNKADRIEVARRQFMTEMKKRELETKQSIERAIISKKERESRKFHAGLKSIEDAKSLLDDIDRNLKLEDETYRNKVRRQFEDWNTNVHGTIQQNIARQVAKLDSKELNAKKNADFSKFIEITSRKPAIFRDIIIESEYDPLEPNRHTIIAKTKKLKDPTLMQQQKLEEEQSMVPSLDGDDGGKRRLCKDTLPVEVWESGKIEGTPHGRFAKMMSGPDDGSGNPTSRSTVVFDDYNFPTGSKSLDSELPRGKRIFPVKVYADPGRIFNQPQDEFSASIKG